MPIGMNWQSMTAIVVVMSALGSAAGVWVTLKVGLSQLQTWRQVDSENIKELRTDVDALKEDALVHDMEIGGLLQRANIDRVRRQVARG